ncbi:hypothetical protein [Acinetobacter terrae]|uniref:hypothetical protein n=1 Tax=Acinetobacter terrae TaxID=2731247 RepID=UPI0013F15BF0|nr:hypothetical protein [Acinetobacter terrae]
MMPQENFSIYASVNQQQHEELEKQNKRSRAKKSMPSHKAQKAVIEQRNLNPVLDSCS